ncbi:uncharacterized protein EMH_0092020 [Eimeria mitis]|uniref:RRP12 HEAT domain-containing protein n=1 Tax=Eimeria mitis TaxID=44415 RepID=U6JQI9_9EIME|nr:uncharacterized protein EMH_0092020 [Eimeria mitis]CDJ27714.1 hypothetical protein, conserved [Eimeria mitis]
MVSLLQQQPQQQQQQQRPQQQQLLLQQQLLAAVASQLEGGAAAAESSGGAPQGAPPRTQALLASPLSAADAAAARTCWAAILSALSSKAAAAEAAAAEQQPLTAAIHVTLQCLRRSLDELQQQQQQQQQQKKQQDAEDAEGNKGPLVGPPMYVLGMSVLLELLFAAAAKAELLQGGEQQQQLLVQLLPLLHDAAGLSEAPERSALSLLQCLRTCGGLTASSSSSSNNSNSNSSSSSSSGKSSSKPIVVLSRGCFEVLLRAAVEGHHVTIQAAAKRLLLQFLSRLCSQLQQEEETSAAAAAAAVAGVGSLISALTRALKQQQQQQQPQQQQQMMQHNSKEHRMLLLLQRILPQLLTSIGLRLDALQQQQKQLQLQQQQQELLKQKERAEALCLLLLRKGPKGAPLAECLETVGVILTELLHQRRVLLQQQQQQLLLSDNQQQQQQQQQQQHRSGVSSLSIASQLLSCLLLKKNIQPSSNAGPRDVAAWSSAAAAAVSAIMLWASEEQQQQQQGAGAAAAPAAKPADAAEEQLLSLMDKLTLEGPGQPQPQQQQQQQQPKDRMSVCLSLVHRFVSSLTNILNKATDPTAHSAAIKAAKRLVVQQQITGVPIHQAMAPFLKSLLHYRHKVRWPEVFKLCGEEFAAVEVCAFRAALDGPNPSTLGVSGDVGTLEACLDEYFSSAFSSLLPVVSTLGELLLAAEGTEQQQEQQQQQKGAYSKTPSKSTAFLKAKQQDLRLYRPQLEYAFGSAVRVFGCLRVLCGDGAAPRLSLSLAADASLSFDAFVERANIWLLPLLQRFVCRDQLQFFLREIIPAAAAVQQRAEEAAAAGHTIESGDWSRVYRQLWGLLPAFSNQPLDLAKCLRKETPQPDGTKEGGPRGAPHGMLLVPRVLELLHDSFLRDAACATIGAMAKSALPPGVQTPELQQQQQQQQQGLSVRDHAPAAQVPSTATGPQVLLFLRRLADAVAAVAAGDGSSAAVKAAAAAAARAARTCCPTDSSLLPAAVMAAATADSNRRALAAYAEETLSFVTVRYLLLHKDTAAAPAAAAARPAEAAFAALTESAKAKAAQQLLQTIQAFAPLCPRALMETNAERFAGALAACISSVSSNTGPPPLAPKECGALLDVCGALRPFTAPDIGAKLFNTLLTLLRRCSAAVSSSSNSSSSSRALLRTLQRKTYMSLKHALDDVGEHEGFVAGVAELLEVWKVLKECREAATAAGDLKQRLSCLLGLLQAFDRRREEFEPTKWEELLQEVLPAAVPEVLLSLKEINKRNRETAAQALDTLATLCEGNQLHLSALVTYVAAGFGGLTPETGRSKGAPGAPPLLKSAAALALGRLFDLYSGELPHKQVQEWAEVGLLLLKDHNKLAFVAGIQFAKACIRAGDMDDLAAWLPSMLAALSNPNAPKARMKIRHLIEKLCKVMGEEALEKAMPEEHIPLLRHLLRSERRRTIRRLIHQTLKGAEESGEESEESVEGRRGQEESETDEDTDDEEGEGELPPRHQKRAGGDDPQVRDNGVEAVGLKSLLDAFEEESDNERKSRRKRHSVPSSGQSLSVFEAADGVDATSAVLDFCGVSAARQILVGMQPQKDRKTHAAARGIKRETKFSLLPLDETGKIIIQEEEEEEQPTEPAAKFHIGKDTGRSNRRKDLKATAAAKPSSSSSTKPSLSSLAARRAALKEKRKQQRGGHFTERSGAEFKARKAKGDVKKKAGVDPYAYIKLNRGILKEKYRAQALRDGMNPMPSCRIKRTTLTFTEVGDEQGQEEERNQTNQAPEGPNNAPLTHRLICLLFLLSFDNIKCKLPAAVSFD